MRKRGNKTKDELRPEYDLSQLLKGGVRGKYAKRYHAGTNLVCRSTGALRAQLERAAVRDRDLDRDVAADWLGVDHETAGWYTSRNKPTARKKARRGYR